VKVLFPFVGDSVGGSHMSVVELYKGLQSQKIHVTILLHSDNKDLSNLLNDLGIPFVFMPIKSLAGDSPNALLILMSIVRNFKTLYFFIQDNNFDIVHGNDLRINLTWSLPARLSGAKFIWHQRVLLSSSIYWKLIPFLSDYFVAISSCVFNSANHIAMDINKKYLIYNPFSVGVQIDGDKFRQKLKRRFDIGDNSIIIGYLGRVKPYKNVDFLIEAFNKFKSSNDKEFFLIIAGKGDAEYIQFLKDKARQLGIGGNIAFIGFTRDTPSFLSMLDILVAPSTVDAFGRSLVEAFLQKTLVIAAKFGGHMEIIEHLKTGYLYEGGNKIDFIKGLSWLLNNRSKIIDNIHNAKYEERFSSENHVNKIIDLYHKALSE
jgi:glycosyltransferase involved in cell wall biosynthesis